MASSGTQQGYWATQAACERALGLTIWNREFVLQAVVRRLEMPPLSTQFNNAERLRQVWNEIVRLRQQEAAPGAVRRVRDEFAVALAQAPADVYLYEGLANFLEAVKDPPGAIAAYRQAVAVMPDDFYDCLQLGRLLGEQGKAGEGESFIEQAVQLRPSLPDGWFEMSVALAAEQKYAPALAYLKQAVRLRPQDAYYVGSVAQLLAKLNRPAEAIANYRQAIRLDPNDWQMHFDLAGELVAAGQPEPAIAEYQEVLKLNPGQVTSRINLGVVLVRCNRLDDAIACFQEALKIEPDNQVAQKYLASVLAHKAQSP